MKVFIVPIVAVRAGPALVNIEKTVSGTYGPQIYTLAMYKAYNMSGV